MDKEEEAKLVVEIKAKGYDVCKCGRITSLAPCKQCLKERGEK